MTIQQDHLGRFWDDNLLENPETNGQKADFEQQMYNDNYYEPLICHHGREMANCEKCDEETEARGGLDKCLNCGRYKYGDQLNEDQVCIKPCKNPNEY